RRERRRLVVAERCADEDLAGEPGVRLLRIVREALDLEQDREVALTDVVRDRLRWRRREGLEELEDGVAEGVVDAVRAVVVRGRTGAGRAIADLLQGWRSVVLHDGH